MVITLSVFYYFYLLVVLFFALYSFFNLYHLLRFGFAGAVNVLVMIFYLAASTALLIFSFQILLAVDWSAPLIDLSQYNFPFKPSWPALGQ